MKNFLNFIIALSFCLSVHAIAWDGEDTETGNQIEIDKGNLVRKGSQIEYYDHDDGTYHDVEVESIRSYGNTTEVEVYDYDTGEYRVLEMDQ